MIHGADAGGIQAVVEQQFVVAREVLAAGLTPIVEPEVSIHAEPAAKAAAETMLVRELLLHLDRLDALDALDAGGGGGGSSGGVVIVKVTLPEVGASVHIHI